MDTELETSQEEIETVGPENRGQTGRNDDGTFKPGFSGNPGGRPKNTLKDYIRIKLSDMTPEQKEQWLKDNKISGDLQWRMAEGQPQQDVTSDGKQLPTPIYIPRNNSTEEDKPTE